MYKPLVYIGRNLKMKKSIGNVVGLYPTPVLVVGAMNDKKPSWTLVAHIGIVSHNRILISLAKSHFINHLIKKNMKLSINMVNEDLLPLAEYCGMNSGDKVDKSNVFEYELCNNIPLINASPLTMECEVESIVEVGVFENFVLKVNNTYTDETNLNAEGKLDIQKVKPILFTMPSYEYLFLGEKKIKCLTLAPNIKN